MKDPTPDEYQTIISARRTVRALERLKENPDFQLLQEKVAARIQAEGETALDGETAEKRENARLRRQGMIEASRQIDTTIKAATNTLANFSLTPEQEAQLDGRS